MQWVETDDLGDSKRQVPAIPRPSMPNGALNQSLSNLQHPQGSLQQLQSGMQQPQGSLQQPSGNMLQPQGNDLTAQADLQQPQGSDLTAQAALQQPQGRYSMTQGFSEQPRADPEPAEPAGDFTLQFGVYVKQEITNNAEVETQDTANLLLRSHGECFCSCIYPAPCAPNQHPRTCADASLQPWHAPAFEVQDDSLEADGQLLHDSFSSQSHSQSHSHSHSHSYSHSHSHSHSILTSAVCEYRVGTCK